MNELPDDSGTTDQSISNTRVEISDHGDTVADADVSISAQPHGVATVAFHAQHGQLPLDTRRDLVNAVMEQPEVADSDHLHAVIPMGDSEFISQLRRRTTKLTARAAGSSSIIEADVPPSDGSTPTTA